MMDLDLDIIV